MVLRRLWCSVAVRARSSNKKTHSETLHVPMCTFAVARSGRSRMLHLEDILDNLAAIPNLTALRLLSAGENDLSQLLTIIFVIAVAALGFSVALLQVVGLNIFFGREILPKSSTDTSRVSPANELFCFSRPPIPVTL